MINSFILGLQSGGSDIAQAASDGDGVVSEETFLFTNLPELWVIGLIIVPAVIAFAWWSYGGLHRLEKRTRILLATLRGLAIAVCLLALFQPSLERIRYTKIQNQIHILVDDSASMQRKDTYPDEDQRTALETAAAVDDLAQYSRADLTRRVLEKTGGLVEQLGASHDLRMFRFERKPLPIRDLSELSSRGPRTQIGDALDLHLGASAAVNLDAVILVSDGRNNTGLSPVEVAKKYRGADLPIYTIGVGDPNPPRNIRLIGPPGPKEALRLEEILFTVTLAAEGGLAGQDVTVSLHGSRDGMPYAPLETQSAVLGQDGQPVKVRLSHAFQEAGDYTLRFEVSSLPEETSFEDNQELRFLRVNDEKIQVLFIDDMPRWEYRYVKNALLRVDPSIDTQCFLCDASRSFKQEHDDDLPALEDIPRTAEELRKYHVILIGDVPPERIASTEEAVDDWLQLLVEFVENGGGVGFLYGDSAMPERYRGTPLEDLLPVTLEEPADLHTIEIKRDEEFTIDIENPMRPHDIVLLKHDPQSNQKLWEEGFEGLRVYYPVKQAKAGATVLFRHPSAENRYGKRVLAATSVYPRGNTFFMGTDETWRWRKFYGEMYHDRFWRNVVRHLASGRLRHRDDRVDLRLDKVTVETGGQVQVNLSIQDDELHPSSLEQMPVFLRKAGSDAQKRALRSIPGELGSYQGSFTMDEPGTYSFLVYQNNNPQDKVMAREDVFVKIPDRELANSSQDKKTLVEIAKASKGGRYSFLAAATELAPELAERRSYEHEVDRSTRPLWDSLWVLITVLSLLSLEWILRKRSRLV